MAEADVEVALAGEAGKRQRAVEKARSLVLEPGAPVMSDRMAVNPEALAERQRLGKVARGDLNLVPLLTQAPDDRREHQHVRGVGEVDPDLHDDPLPLVTAAAPGLSVRGQRGHDFISLGAREHGTDRQRQDRACELIGDRQLVCGREPRHRRLSMQRGAVVGARLHPSRVELGQLGVGIIRGRDIQVPGRDGPGERSGKLEVVAKAGVDVDALGAQLQVDGAKSFVKSWEELMEVIRSKTADLRTTAAG